MATMMGLSAICLASKSELIIIGLEDIHFIGVVNRFESVLSGEKKILKERSLFLLAPQYNNWVIGRLFDKLKLNRLC